MRLHLIRHGDAQRPSPDRPDAERALTEDGRSQTRVHARGIAELVHGLDRIATSPYRRAQQTAAVLADVLDVGDVAETASLVPDADPERAVDDLLGAAAEAPRVAVVGHRPQLAGLAAALLCEDADRFDVHLETASLMSIRLEAGGEATIERLAQGPELRALGRSG